MKLKENPIDSPEEIAVRKEIAAGNLDNALLLVKEIEETDLCDEMFYLIAIAFMQNPYRDEFSARRVEERTQNPEAKAECAAAVTGIRDGFLLQRMIILMNGGEIRSAKIVKAAIKTSELKAQAEELLPEEAKKVMDKETPKTNATAIAARDEVRRNLYAKHYEDPNSSKAADIILVERIKALVEESNDLGDKVRQNTMDKLMAAIKSPKIKAIAAAIRKRNREETETTFQC